MDESWLRFGASLCIGLLIGLERERNPAAKAGVRTFALVALAGALTAVLDARLGGPWTIAAGRAAVSSPRSKASPPRSSDTSRCPCCSSWS